MPHGHHHSDIHRSPPHNGNSSKIPDVPPLPPGFDKADGLLRPDSAASRRPSSSYLPISNTPDRPQPRRVASTNSSINTQRRLKYAASDPHIGITGRDHGLNHRPPPSPPADDSDEQHAQAPVVSMGPQSSRDRAQSLKQQSRRSVFRFGHGFTFRSHNNSSQGSNTPKSRTSDADGASVAEGKRSLALGNRPSTSTVDSRRDVPEWSSHLSQSAALARQSVDNLGPNNKQASHRSSIFKLTRRKKVDSLFPLPDKVSPSKITPSPSPNVGGSQTPVPRRSSGDLSGVGAHSTPNGPSHPVFGGMLPEDLVPHGSSSSVRSARSSPPVAGNPFAKPNRSRSGTTISFPGQGHPHLLSDSGRNSTASTTLGRNSIAAVRSITSKLRNSDAHSTHNGPSGNSSFALSRETLIIPDREDGETPGKYFARLETEYPKRAIALALSKSNDSFSHDALRSLARTFKFYEEPIDMSLRKFLWEIPLTGEAQQIDRVMSAFSERYHECNPHIFVSSDEANYVAFSLIILHSDLFNPSVKNKMLRHQYQKNTRDVGIPAEVLGYFYDNIAYTEFIHEEADQDDGEKRSKSAYKKAKKVKARLAAPEMAKHDKLDPYDVLLDEKINIENLRPALKNELNLEDTYTYTGTHYRFDIPNLRIAFARFGVLQIVSERSRPEAFTAQSTIDNPNQAQAGVVSIKVAKVGIVWRKSAKKRKTRSPWQEWGVILTQSQLFFHRNLSWIKSLMGQAEVHFKGLKKGSEVIFRPPLQQLLYDGSVATHDAVAMQDTSYKRHKHAFVLARRPTAMSAAEQGHYFEETLLAESDAEMNDWIAKINYASTFKTTNIPMAPQHARARRRSGGRSRDLSTDGTWPPADDSHTKAALARAHMAKTKLVAIEEDAKTQIKRLEDNLRVARHLEILAPFLSKTRNELLAYGARLAHNIRWNRFDVLRLKCHREILFKDLQEDESTISSRGISALYPDRPPRLSPMLPATPQIDVTAPSPRSGQYPTIVEVQTPKQSSSQDQHPGDYIEGIDEAFATPPETQAQMDARFHDGDNPFRLQPMHLDGAASTSAPPSVVAPRRESLTSSVGLARPTSASSSASLPSAADEEPRQSSVAGSERGSLSHRPSNAGSGRSSRRPLPRTLREPRDSHSSQQSRPRMRRDGTSVNGDDAASTTTTETEGLTRRPGSFTVHGKKASVITLGSEWQQVSAEERLRLRKLALQNDGKRMSLAEAADGSIQGGYEGSQVELAYEDEGDEDGAGGRAQPPSRSTTGGTT